ncbi:MAG: mechanosensitive ion channel domain-containing protein [Planctomycetota bacterium]|nr:mechanosensitive ion channel domain-containing protein [Planctomycetota bacterium]MEC9009951.1 mechanosensitive ion channel domain-containing protein [Planctomycetota bacterium]MED5449380.1 mechanosensitive ion channel domain-containing protein [Planctomycetota bacterium]
MTILISKSIAVVPVDQAKTAVETGVGEVSSALQTAFQPVINLLPSVVAMVAVLVVGYVVARLLARAANAVGQRIGLDGAAERSGLSASMTKVGIERGLSAIVAQLVFWMLMCVFVVAAFNLLNLPSLSAATQKLVDYIPKLLAATTVVLIGLLIASFLRGVIATAADRIGISYADRLASGAYYILALMTFIAAFDQLEIQFALLNQLILIAFGALALGVGLSVGLGGRDVAGGIMSGYYVRQRMQSGDTVSVSGIEGVVREVGPVATVIETTKDGLSHRHTVPNSKMLNEAVR